MKTTSCTCKENILKYSDDEENVTTKTSIFFPEGTSFIFEAIECIQNEMTTKRQAEGLKKILEQYETEDDVHISDVVNLIHELDGTDPSYRPNERIIAKLRRKVEIEGGEHMRASQCLAYLGNEIKTETEEELLRAFMVFDKKNTGKVSLSELKYILGERGNSLNDDEMKLANECSRSFQVETSIEKPKEPVHSVKATKRKRFRKVRKMKKSKDKKNERDGVDQISVTETKVDYRGFIKALLEQISTQESKLRSC